eukprot:TRINITY_DN9_c0_g2_i1.p2 TRINITY_DN9_c0_g2~~TRINITY_DN9_c0_g2_i1.p2  ORF type:complete len:857 (+),score=378.31 TRINITY_DN9_c0_g2_i1:231-2573(+)
MVRGTDLLDRFQGALERGLWDAPEDQYEKVKQDTVPSLFSENLMLDIIVSLLAMLATISAAGAGIGGGGLLVPIYLLVLGWGVSGAVPLSNATIFGNAITNIFINFPLRHPTADRPLVDFDLALILIPMELTGSLIGVLLNIIFPQWLTLLCLLVLLMGTTQRTYFKGKAAYEKENAERKKIARVEDAKKTKAGEIKQVTMSVFGAEGGKSVEFDVVNKQSRAVTYKLLEDALLIVREGKQWIFRDASGEKLNELSYGTVDAEEEYTVEVQDIPSGTVLNTEFRTLWTEPASEPLEDDLNKLIVLEPGVAETKRFAGKGLPLEAWTAEMVLSWFQAVCDDCMAQCYLIEQKGWTGKDLIRIVDNAAEGVKEWAAVGVSVGGDQELLMAHAQELKEQDDSMLVVYTTKDMPWASWNRSAEWQDAAEQLEGNDADGWKPEDPAHPKNNPETYVSSQSYVSVSEWTCNDVLKWVSKVTDFNYSLKQKIVENNINGVALLKLTVEDARSLGVPQLGPRLALMARIRELEDLYEEHKQIVESERAIPWRTNLQVLFWSWFMLLVLAVLKGGGKSGGQSPVAGWQGKSQEEFCGSAMFWVLWWIGVPVLVVVTWLAGNYLLEKHARKVKVHFAFHEGDVRWTDRRVRLYPVIVIAAGVLAGLLGVGGAMVTGPLMLEMNVMPRVSTGTSSFLIIFTTGVAAIAYIALGALPIDYAIWFAIMGAVGAAIGLNVIQVLLKKYNRQSMVIWSLTLVFILAMVGTLVSLVTRVMEDLGEGNNMGLRPICA